MISETENAGGSVPNLATYTEDEDFPKKMNETNLSKRKVRTEEWEYKMDFANFKKEIMDLLQGFGKTQSENLTQIKDEILEIKSEIQTVKLATENFTHQFDRLNNEITNIKSQNSETQDKIRQIETEMTMLKIQKGAEASSSAPQDVLASEELLHELKDRCDREKNIVVVGIPEKNEKNSKLRRNYDEEEVGKVISTLDKDCPKPIKSIRLGKYIPEKNRPVKVYFSDTNTPRSLLRQKSSLPENIQIYADQTPSQKQHWQSMKEELKKRTENGEKDLLLKYIKGIPKIITSTTNPKN